MKIVCILLGLIVSTLSEFIQRITDDVHSIQTNEFREISKFVSKSGTIKIKTQQQYKGVDIYGATLVIEENEENVFFPVFGWYFDTNIIKQDFDDDVNPLISSDVALQRAISHYIPNGDITSLFGYEWDESQTTTTVDLNLYKNEKDGVNKFTLSYIIQFTYQEVATQNVYRPFTVIDAKSGDILYTINALISHALISQNEFAYGTGGNAKTGPDRHGPMPITAAPNVRNERVEVFAYPLSGSNNPTLGQCNYDQEPTQCEIQDIMVNTATNTLADAYMWANVVFNLYDDWGPRNENGQPIPPLTPNDLPLKFYVHYGTNFENAFYSGGAMYFGDGNTRFYPLVSLDVSSHEVAHGFTTQGSNLRYQDQSGGINEAYSDLAGEAAEAYHRGEEAVRWMCGYDIYKATESWCSPNCALRYLYNPPLDGNSIDHVNNYYNGMNVHYSSGVYNKGWYNLVNLDLWQHWTVQDVFLLASQANYYYWGRDTTYNEGLCAMIQAVEDIFAQSQWEERKQDVALAWQLQGVYCMSKNNIKFKANMPPTSGNKSNNDYSTYYIYGGVLAGMFAVVIVFGVCFYRQRSKTMENQLNDGNNFYGTIVSDERQ